MKNSQNPTVLLFLILLILFQNCSQEKNVEGDKENSDIAYYTEDDFATVGKFDSHQHFNYLDTAYINQTEKDNFLLLNITDDRPFGLPMEDQQKIAVQLVEDFSPRVAYATTFSVKDWHREEWQEETISDLK